MQPLLPAPQSEADHFQKPVFPARFCLSWWALGVRRVWGVGEEMLQFPERPSRGGQLKQGAPGAAPGTSQSSWWCVWGGGNLVFSVNTCSQFL